MTVTVKSRTSLAIPPQVQRRAGLMPGDRVQFRVSGGIINIIPDLPPADDEYTLAERRTVDKKLREAGKGPYHGPFETADAAVKFLRKEIETDKQLNARRLKSQ